MRAAENLEGLDLDGGWHVDKLLKRPRERGDILQSAIWQVTKKV